MAAVDTSVTTSPEVLIVGAGPVGLTLASFLGAHGIRTQVIEALDGLIDYPRAVGMDDECLRTFQSLGLTEKVLPFTTPDHWMRFTSAKGAILASIEPRARPYGWPRRNAFLQPHVDRVIFEGLARYSSVSVQFKTQFVGLTQDADGVLATVQTDGLERTIRARYMVGCDGGRSPVRKALGVSFEGQTESTKWLVLDLANDPVGEPNCYLQGDPARPTVSIALPQAVRRFEFMVLPDESEETLTTRESINKLLTNLVDSPEDVHVIRSRVYTHHARLAADFRKGRVMLAGDAAHLMPVWQGQGYNSGIRDATNLGWKLIAVLKNHADDVVLNSYGEERREHAEAMIKLSVTAGNIFSPRNRLLAGARDIAAAVLNFFPSMKSYFTEMRFKPMPRYTRGVLLQDDSDVAVGQLVPQPIVRTSEGEVVRLDTALSNWFAVVCWGNDPRACMDEGTLAYWTSLGARLVTIVPTTQLADAALRYNGTTVIGDELGILKEWFGERKGTVAVIRPDRFVAARTTPQGVNAMTKRFAAKMLVTQPSPNTTAKAAA